MTPTKLAAAQQMHASGQRSIATTAALDVSRTPVYRHLPGAGSAHHSPGGR